MKTSTRFNLGRGVRGRDVDFPREPELVTDAAQAKLVDINTARKFDFSQQHQGSLPQRPSTSGGTPNSSRRRDAEKRETKDDLHFNPLAAHGKGTTFYNFPLPGSLPRPDQTQRSSPPPPRKSSLAKPRSYTPDSIEPVPSNMPVQPMEIGMALGSPTHQPTDWQAQTRFETITRSPSPDVMDDASLGGLVAPPKPKASKWKILGGIFGGRKHSASQATPFYQLQPEPTQTPVAPQTDFVSFGEPTTSEARPKSRGRGRTLSERKTKKNKPDLRRAETAPLRFDFQETGQQRSATPEITLEGESLMEKIRSDHTEKPYNGQMLDVDIPSIQLERYSVMFGSVLPKPTTTASSLLARRQATLDKLKTVNEALASKEQELRTRERLLRPRRATSPQPTKSPAFSLFPNTPSRLTVKEPSPAGPRNSPLQRSNTSPAALSPSRPTFAPGPENDAHAILISPPTNLIGPSHPQYNGPSIAGKALMKEEPKPTTSHPKQQVTRNWSPDHSQLILDSPSSDVEEEEAETEDIYDTSPLPMRPSDAALLPMKPKLVEPSWQMVNAHVAPPASTSSSVSGSTTDSDHSVSTTSTSKSSVSASSAPHSGSSTHKAIIISSPPPPKTRQRSATTTGMRQRRNPSEVSNASITSSNFSTIGSIAHEDENEARLKTAADVSIARQISVSRQQRQLLIPIKTKTSSNTSLNKKYNQNFPSPINGNLGVNRVASPLGAVATAVAEERDREGRGKDRAGSPLVERKDRGEKIERLVEGIKPNTPTLVVVPGPDKNEMVKAWGGATAVHSTPVGLAERRRGSGNAMGEIKVGLAVNVGRGAAAHGHAQRKSERVIVERVSIASN